MIWGGLSIKMYGEGLRGGKIAAYALPCKAETREGGIGTAFLRGWQRERSACVIWKRGLAQTGNL